MAVDSDVDALIARLEGLGARDVVDIVVDGQADLGAMERLQAALRKAEALARSIRADLGALRLVPTEEDIAGLHADGYVGDVIAELREHQQGDGDAAATAAHALALLTGMLSERRHADGSAA